MDKLEKMYNSIIKQMYILDKSKNMNSSLVLLKNKYKYKYKYKNKNKINTR